VLVRHQLLILNRSRKRALNLRVSDRIIAGLCTLLMRPARVLRSAIVLKPSTLLHFHKMLIKRKYRLLFSPKQRRRPGPKGPAEELIDAVVAMKQRNPTWGCRRIAQQISLAFGVRHRQRRCPQDSRGTFSAGIGLIGSVVAYVPWPYEGQFVERRPVSV
jgi:putative transposase